MRPTDRDATLDRTVWDVPTRLFHWLLVLLLLVSWVSAEFDSTVTSSLNQWFGLGLGSFQLHFWSGYAILTLIVFRVLWGLVGSETARFSSFVRGPKAAIRHIRHLLFGTPSPDEGPGHNPVGGWMVIVLLLVVWLQAFSGLFTTDDLFVDGPLAYAVSSDTRGDMSTLHRQNVNIILGLSALHILAVFLYWIVWRQNLIRPMVTGRKRFRPEEEVPQTVPVARAVLVLLVSIGIVIGVIQFGSYFAS